MCLFRYVPASSAPRLPLHYLQAMELCSAVKQMHDMGLTHHDIKPENIYIDGDEMRVSEGRDVCVWVWVCVRV